MSESNPIISFENTEIAYRSKSNSQLIQSYYLYKLMSFSWLVNMGNPIIQFLISVNFPGMKTLVKNTIFKQFCGGESLEETKELIDELKISNIEVLLNYSVEGLDDAASYKATYEKTLEMIHFSKENPSIRAVCVKFTGYASIDLWTKVQAKLALTEQENQEYEQAKAYIEHLCLEAVEADVQLYVDAEESWFQDAIDDLVDQMMAKFNQEEAYIFNTFQLYRHDKLEHLKRSHELAISKGYILGAKIVRGAYVEKENNYAEKNGIASPINNTKELSDDEFNKALIYCIENIEKISLCCASHNEYSNELLVSTIESKKIDKKHRHISSSQLQGMSDNITYNLNNLGVNTAKYVPFGPIKEVIPYLIRRAQENTSVAGQTSRELLLIENEIKRRGI